MVWSGRSPPDTFRCAQPVVAARCRHCQTVKPSRSLNYGSKVSGRGRYAISCPGPDTGGQTCLDGGKINHTLDTHHILFTPILIPLPSTLNALSPLLCSTRLPPTSSLPSSHATGHPYPPSRLVLIRCCVLGKRIRRVSYLLETRLAHEDGGLQAVRVESTKTRSCSRCSCFSWYSC